MKNRKIDELSYKIYSDRFNYEVHHNIDNFRYIISDLVNVIDTFNSSFLNIDINKLPKVKQNEIYNYKILLVEEQIKKIKEDYYDFQKNRQIVGTELEHFKQFKETILKQALLDKKNLRFYNLQLLFSNHNDYLELKNDNITKTNENKLLEFLVFNIDKISDTLLIKLGFLGEKYQELIDERKKKTKKLPRLLLDLQMLYKKIQAVNLFKDSLKGWSPLNIVNNYDTTRMMIINSLDNNNGKIILTQTPDSFNKISKKLDISKTISVYNDVFSLYRSQIYSLKNIEDKKIDIKLIENISHQMYMSWNNMDNNERKTGVESINSGLDNYNSYYENRVKLFRMPKIKLKNKVTDSNVVYGVKNDLSNSTKKLNNTKSFITNQKEIIEDIISEHITKYRFFISGFKDILKTLDQEEIYNNIDNNNPDNQIFNNYNKTFKQLIGLLDTFLIGNFNDIPKPFNEFYITISNCKQKIIKGYNNGDIDTLFRQLLIIHLELKLIRFDIFKKIYETEIKLENIDIDTKENKEYYKNLYTELLKYQEILIRKNFLGKYKIGKGIDNRFQKRLDNIDNILLKINNIKKVID